MLSVGYLLEDHFSLMLMVHPTGNGSLELRWITANIHVLLDTAYPSSSQ